MGARINSGQARRTMSLRCRSRTVPWGTRANDPLRNASYSTLLTPAQPTLLNHTYPCTRMPRRPRLHYRLLTLCPAPTDPVPRGLLTLCGPELACVYAYMYFSIPQPCALYAYLSHPIGVSLEPRARTAQGHIRPATQRRGICSSSTERDKHRHRHRHRRRRRRRRRRRHRHRRRH